LAVTPLAAAAVVALVTLEVVMAAAAAAVRASSVKVRVALAYLLRRLLLAAAGAVEAVLAVEAALTLPTPQELVTMGVTAVTAAVQAVQG
jgi:hypothetical protein